MKLGSVIRVGLSALILSAASASPLQVNQVHAKPGIVIRTSAPKTLATQQTGSGMLIAFDWQYIANLPVCGSTLQACYDGFQMTDVTTGVMIGGVDTNLPIGPTALSFNWSPTGGVPYGSQTFSLVAHGYDQNGVAVVSTPATVTVVVPVVSLNGPTGLTGVTQP